MIPERNIQLQLWRMLTNVIEGGFSFNGVEFVEVKFEQPSIDGRPDLVVMAREGGRELPILVIETKRKVPYREPRFDPFGKDVIAQAERYATWLGAPYFATCDGRVLVIFETFKVGVPLPQRKMRDYEVPWPLDQRFAKALLEEVGKFRTGVGKWLPLDDVFVQRLRSFHRFITPFMHRALRDKLRDDAAFRERYVKWLRSQVFEFSDEMNERIAEQASYLLMNRIAFYKTLETQMPLPRLGKIDSEDTEEFARTLRTHFDKVLDVNYEAIFEKNVFDEIPLPPKLTRSLNDFIEELGTYNLAKIRSDVLGRVYEGLIPGGERHRLGQYYTPPPIVELIVELCMRSPSDRVLDPGCGSGGFLVKAYHKLRDLKRRDDPLKDEAELHREILDQLRGIDINAFPAQLAAMNLAARNLKVRSDNIGLVVSDFFKIAPDVPVFPKEFDAVVTNPPYTRQEEMEYKEEIRDAALTYTDGSKISMDARAGIYAYFFTHSAKFLKNGGRMGYITSNTWLDVGFGKGLKEFFLDHFNILAIVEFDAAVFGKALVNTCVSIFEKAEETSQERRRNIVKFVRLKKPMDIGEVVKTIWSADRNYEDHQIRIVLKKQGELKPKERWGKYIRAPAIYFKVVRHPKMVALGEKAEIKRGITTGSNEFFILDQEKVKLWGIEPEFLKPVISSVRDIDFIKLNPHDVAEHVLAVHELKSKLEGRNVLKYIEHGERIEITTKRGTRVAAEVVKGVHNLRTCRGRRIWYDLGKRKTAPILFPYLMWERNPFIWNRAQAYASDVFHEMRPYSDKDTMVLLGLLNSTLTAFLLELHGRSYGGGVLKIQVYEVKKLPVIDPSQLEDKERKRIKEAFQKLCEAQRGGDEEAEGEARTEIDSAVFDALSLTDGERRQVYEGLEALRRMRLQRKEVEVLVETPEEWRPPRRKEKAPEERPSRGLGPWLKGET